MIKLIIIAVLLVVFSIQYSKPKQSFEILQMDIKKLNPSVLFEKQPIILYDTVDDLNDFISNEMMYLYHFKKTNQHFPSENFVLNQSRIAILHNDAHQDITIYIKKHLVKKDFFSPFNVVIDPVEPDLTLKLMPGNLIILPYLFSFRSEVSVPVSYLTDVFHCLAI